MLNTKIQQLNLDANMSKKEERLKKRAYKKLMRKQKKERIKWAKEFRMWDWGFLDDLIFNLIAQMKDYYELGWNVWQIEESKQEIIDELKEALRLKDAREDAYTNYIEKYPTLEPIKYTDENGFECWKFDDGLNEDQAKEKYKACKEAMKAEQKAYEKAYTYIGKHLRGWWD